jgi:hypothetical protein
VATPACPHCGQPNRSLSDPTVLVFEQGFSIHSYVWTGVACLAVLAVAYGLGLRKERECGEGAEG